MRTARLALIVALGLAAGCAGAAPGKVTVSAGAKPGAPAAPLGVGAPVTIVPMKLVVRTVDPPKMIVELKPDGKVIAPTGALIGRIDGARVVDTDGKELLHIASDNSVDFPDMGEKLKFDDDDALSSDKGMVKVGSDGILITTDAGETPTRTPLKFVPFDTKGRRAAILVLLLMAKKLEGVADLTL